MTEQDVSFKSDFNGRSWHSQSGSGHSIENAIKPDIHCDCSSPGRLSNNFVTVLVTVHYLTLLCTKYCANAAKVEKRRWRPAYMPPSTSTESPTSPSWDETTLFHSHIQSENVWKVLTPSTTPSTPTTVKLSRNDLWRHWSPIKKEQILAISKMNLV